MIRGWASLLQREMLDFSTRATAAQRIVAAADIQTRLFDELVIDHVGLTERALMAFSRFDLAAVVVAVAADAGDDVDVATRPPAPLFVVSDVEHTVRIVQTVIAACTRPVGISMSASGADGEAIAAVRIGPHNPEAVDRVQSAMMLAGIDGGGVRVEGDELVFWLRLPPEDG